MIITNTISYRNPEKYFDDLISKYLDSIQYFGGTKGLADTNEAASVSKSFTCPSNGIVIIRGARWTDSTGNGGGNNNLVVKINGTQVYSATAGTCVLLVSSGDTIQASQGQKGNASLSCVVASVTGTFLPLE